MKIWFFSLLIVIPFWSGAQQLQLALGPMEQHTLDSLRKSLNTASSDSARFQIANTLGSFFLHKNTDSAFKYMEYANEISVKSKKYLAEAASLMKLQNLYRRERDLAKAYKALMRALEITEDPGSENTHFIPAPGGNSRKQRLEILTILYGGGYGDLLVYTKNNQESIEQYKKGIRVINEIGYFTVLPQFYLHMTWAYKAMNMTDSALFYVELAEQTAKEKNIDYHIEFILNEKGNVYLMKGMIEPALENYNKAKSIAERQTNNDGMLSAYLGLARSYLEIQQKDSSMFYALKANHIANLSGKSDEASNQKVYETLSQSYLLNHEKDSAFKYLTLAKQFQEEDNDNYVKSLAEFQHVFLEDRAKLQEAEKERIQFRNRIRTYLLSGGIVTLLLLSVIFYRTIRQKQKANDTITKAYSELRDTQQQLVQREKMASLGELTAGIAHEIQNPLNFVNNFSELNTELIAELETAAANGDLEEIKSLAKGIKENEEKIVHHGKRAEGIVKSMLQHSRTGTGKKEPIDINALCDEYLRLAYHGYRAKDKSFKAKFETDFDSYLPKVNVVAQDIGRVILNLINNAFYAVHEKAMKNPDEYAPLVKVSTIKTNGKIEIKIADNGNGIPQKLQDKVFQPFFTTKPTGHGTGLGLSLSYDIVTKMHGGELKLVSKEEEGTTFNVTLNI